MLTANAMSGRVLSAMYLAMPRAFRKGAPIDLYSVSPSIMGCSIDPSENIDGEGMHSTMLVSMRRFCIVWDCDMCIPLGRCVILQFRYCVGFPKRLVLYLRVSMWYRLSRWHWRVLTTRKSWTVTVMRV